MNGSPTRVSSRRLRIGLWFIGLALVAASGALVDSRVADLQRLRAVLKDLIGRCDQRSGKVACPIIESLARQG